MAFISVSVPCSPQKRIANDETNHKKGESGSWRLARNKPNIEKEVEVGRTQNIAIIKVDVLVEVVCWTAFFWRATNYLDANVKYVSVLLRVDPLNSTNCSCFHSWSFTCGSKLFIRRSKGEHKLEMKEIATTGKGNSRKKEKTPIY